MSFYLNLHNMMDVERQTIHVPGSHGDQIFWYDKNNIWEEYITENIRVWYVCMC